MWETSYTSFPTSASTSTKAKCCARSKTSSTSIPTLFHTSATTSSKAKCCTRAKTSTSQDMIFVELASVYRTSPSIREIPSSSPAALSNISNTFSPTKAGPSSPTSSEVATVVSFLASPHSTKPLTSAPSVDH